jgi:two-component system nitrate/nitrite response regulator NarL
MMRILVVDDHPLFRDGLISLLEAADFEIAGQAEDGESAIEAVTRLQPDLVLLDLKMPGMNGHKTLENLKAQYPDIWVVILTVSEDDKDLFTAIEAGADGYLQKNLKAEDLMDLLSGLEAGDAAITRKTAARLMAGIARSPRSTSAVDINLTAKENEVLTLVAEGQTNRKIAQNRTEAVTTAIQSGLLETSRQRL